MLNYSKSTMRSRQGSELSFSFFPTRRSPKFYEFVVTQVENRVSVGAHTYKNMTGKAPQATFLSTPNLKQLKWKIRPITILEFCSSRVWNLKKLTTPTTLLQFPGSISPFLGHFIFRFFRQKKYFVTLCHALSRYLPTLVMGRVPNWGSGPRLSPPF